MKQTIKVAITMIIAAAIPTAILAIVSLIREVSITDALAKPAFWVVTAVTATIAGLIALDSNNEKPAKPTPTNSWVLVARSATATTVVAALIGVLIAIATETSIVAMATRRPFLITAGIAIIAAALNAWPSDKEKDPNHAAEANR